VRVSIFEQRRQAIDNCWWEGLERGEYGTGRNSYSIGPRCHSAYELIEIPSSTPYPVLKTRKNVIIIFALSLAHAQLSEVL
jgi:hypothetical protein